MTYDDPALSMVGQSIAGRYHVERLLGRGGAGAVYQATQSGLERKVALKLLHPRSAADEATRKRFIREAHITSQLHHPNAVTIFDFGEHDGQLYIVMELLTGRALRTAIHPQGPGMVLERALTLGLQVAEVLNAAHSIQLIHRDLKPENVMLDHDSAGHERAVVVDFGLAFINSPTDGPEELGRITATGMIVGTPAYLSPEQAMGQTITPATDIYAFGCMLYEMITGSTPYQGSTVIGIINQHLYMDPPSIKDTHPSLKAPFGLDQLLLSSMRKDPAARPNAALLCEMLSRLLAGAERFQARPGRGRSSQDLQPRHERVGIVTTAVPSSLTETDGFPSELLISTPNASVMDGLEPITLLNHPCDGALAAALAVQGMRGVSVEQVAEVETDVVFAPQVTPDTVRALIASGRWVVTTAHPGDMERIQALIRAGAADVVSPSPTPLKLSRKLSRALRRSKTPKT